MTHPSSRSPSCVAATQLPRGEFVPVAFPLSDEQRQIIAQARLARAAVQEGLELVEEGLERMGARK